MQDPTALTNTDKALTDADEAQTRAGKPGQHTDARYLHSWLTDLVIGLFYRVFDALGFGFLESVYRNALALELRRAGVEFEREVPIDVWYGGEKVGHFRADFLVEGRVLLEIKASQALSDADRKQVMNYLRGTGIEVALLLHFGPKPRCERILYTNDRKPRAT
ncbi:MAG TPA: GxxExxY protein [Gemmatimonadaceae bacterium]|nr:GxxExxY protein [Gemmatimonadaceae bacterium]